MYMNRVNQSFLDLQFLCLPLLLSNILLGWILFGLSRAASLSHHRPAGASHHCITVTPGAGPQASSCGSNEKQKFSNSKFFCLIMIVSNHFEGLC